MKCHLAIINLINLFIVMHPTSACFKQIISSTYHANLGHTTQLTNEDLPSTHDQDSSECSTIDQRPADTDLGECCLSISIVFDNYMLLH